MGKDRVKAFIKEPRIKMALNLVGEDNGLFENTQRLDFIYNSMSDESILDPMLIEDADDIAEFTNILLSIYPDILNHVTNIPFEMFAAYNNNYLEIPGTIETIDVMAFIGAHINKLIIPTSVLEVWDQAFDGFSGSIYYKGSWDEFVRLIKRSPSSAFRGIEPEDIDKIICEKDGNDNLKDEFISYLTNRG